MTMRIPFLVVDFREGIFVKMQNTQSGLIIYKEAHFLSINTSGKHFLN